MGLIGGGFASRLSPILTGIGGSLMAGGNLDQAGALIAQAQQQQGVQQLRNLQAQQVQAGLEEQQRKQQQDEALRAAIGQGGLFGGQINDAQRAFLQANPAVAGQVIGAQLKQRLAPAVETPLQVAQRQKAEAETAKIQKATSLLDQPGGGKPATTADRKVGNFATRMFQAENRLRKIGPQVDVAGAILPDAFASFVRSSKGQRYRQAAMQWIRANLRKESGAVIGKEEAEEEWKTYFPVPGDTADVIRQKQQARLEVMEATRGEAGRGFANIGGRARDQLLATLQAQEQRNVAKQAIRQPAGQAAAEPSPSNVLEGPGPQPSSLAINRLRGAPTDANINNFNNVFGPGAAERVLGVQ